MEIEELAKKAYYAYQKPFTSRTPWEDLDIEDKQRWFEVVSAISPEHLPLPSPDRCFWEVTAGVIPEHPMPKYTRRFHVTSYDHETSHGDITAKRMIEALEYTRSLHLPESLNWVKFLWIWV